jgi:uncharacterized protein (DUF983 family)
MAGAAPSCHDSGNRGAVANAESRCGKGYDDRQHEDKPLAATMAVLAFLFVALGLTAASIGLLLAHSVYAAWMLFESIAR